MLEASSPVYLTILWAHPPIESSWYWNGVGGETVVAIHQSEEYIADVMRTKDVMLSRRTPNQNRQEKTPTQTRTMTVTFQPIGWSSNGCFCSVNLCAWYSTRALVDLRPTEEGLSELPTTGNPALFNIPVVPLTPLITTINHLGLSDNVAYLGIQGVPGLLYWNLRKESSTKSSFGSLFKV